MSINQFDQLRQANISRCREIFHELDAWRPTDWMAGAAGESGEVIEVLLLALTTVSKSTLVANSVKKLRRLDDGTNQAKDPQSREQAINAIADELADSIIYQDLLAARLGIDLWRAIVMKFNQVSESRESTVFLVRDGTPRSQALGTNEKVTNIPTVEDIDFWHDRGDVGSMYIACQIMAKKLRSSREILINWRPIETAPKDNKRALLLATLNENGSIREIDFDGAWDWIPEEPPHAGFYGWCSAYGIDDPTHWAYQE